MYASLTAGIWALVCASLLTLVAAAGQAAVGGAAKSPWGPDDEIGSLNMMTDASRFDILKQIAAGKVYDLSVDLYVGMPGCCAPFGDPTYQIWMTHTPKRPTAKTSPQEGGELASYSGDAVSMYTHTGTHIDTLNHFGLHGKIYKNTSVEPWKWSIHAMSRE